MVKSFELGKAGFEKIAVTMKIYKKFFLKT